MGLAEKEFVDMFREMKSERHGAPISDDGVAILAAARMLKRTMEKCAIEICGAIEGMKE